MSFYPEFKGIALMAYNEMVEEMFRKAEVELKLNRTELVLRPIRPEDVGLTTPEWYFLFNGGSAAWNTIISVTIADNRYVGLNGVYHNEAITDASQVKVTRAGSVIRYWPTHQITQWKHLTGWVDDPFIVGQNTILTIEAWSRTASTTVDFGFIGAVVEKKGLLINP